MDLGMIIQLARPQSREHYKRSDTISVPYSGKYGLVNLRRGTDSDSIGGRLERGIEVLQGGTLYSRTSQSEQFEKQTSSLERTKLQSWIVNPVPVIHQQPP